MKLFNNLTVEFSNPSPTSAPSGLDITKGWPESESSRMDMVKGICPVGVGQNFKITSNITQMFYKHIHTHVYPNTHTH